MIVPLLSLLLFPPLPKKKYEIVSHEVKSLKEAYLKGKMYYRNLEVDILFTSKIAGILPQHS